MTRLVPVVLAGPLQGLDSLVHVAVRTCVSTGQRVAASHLLLKLFLTVRQFVWDLSDVDMWTNKIGYHGYGKWKDVNVLRHIFL